MYKNYHERKFKELQSEENVRIRAITDYNIMMGNLEDPDEAEEEEENEQSQ